MAQFGDVAALVGGQRVGPAEMNKKQVILLQIMTKGLLIQGAVTQLADKAVLDIGAPFVVASRGQVRKTVAHEASGSERRSGSWARVGREPGNRQLKPINPRSPLDSYAGANRIRFNRTSTWTRKSPCAISAGFHRHPVKQVSLETISLGESCNPVEG